MSLTSHLADPTSPVRRYFETTYTRVDAVRFADTTDPVSTITIDGRTHALTTEARFVPGPVQVPVPAETDSDGRYDRGLAGAAFDYRLRLLLAHQDPHHFVAATGAQMLASRWRRRTPSPAWTELVETINGTQATTVETTTRDGSSAEMVHLTRLCGLLALYDQVRRAPSEYLDDHPLVLAGPDATLDEHLRLVDGRLVDDVTAMTRLFVDSQPDLAAARGAADGSGAVISNPTFDRSNDLAGADADLVVANTLLELKAVATATLSKTTVWQVLGYVLADTTDRHHIRALGWYFARHGYLWRLPVTEFLTRLRGAPTDLAQARAEFADVLAAANPASRTVEGPPQGVVVASKIERTVSFFPNASGRGRWHIARAQIFGTSEWGDPAGPICGTRSVLNLEATPARPPLAQPWAADPRLCGTCIQYTRAGWGDLTMPDGHLPDLQEVASS